MERCREMRLAVAHLQELVVDWNTRSVERAHAEAPERAQVVSYAAKITARVVQSGDAH